MATLKLLVLGESAVGKSSLLLRFTDDTFEPYLNPTIAGQERFRTLTPSYYRGAQGVILVYDVTRKDTFTEVMTWLNELETYATQSNIVKMLVGNKIDKVSLELSSYAHTLETSAKTRDGVQCAFEEVVIKILQTPELWDKDKQKFRVQLETTTPTEEDFCGGYCTLT
uniref:Uncharacterized protein n=1 Tax=Chelonoidis abingdonii TaxID=106734 RepID=A0A8C0JER9_CHEAB